MALRIGQAGASSKPAIMTDEEQEPEAAPQVAEMPMEDMATDMMDMKSEIAKVSPESARYLLPEYRCGSCIHFLDNGSDMGECEIVAGEIYPEGSCSLYEPDTEMLAPEEPMEGALEPAVPKEAPDEEEV